MSFRRRVAMSALLLGVGACALSVSGTPRGGVSWVPSARAEGPLRNLIARLRGTDAAGWHHQVERAHRGDPGRRVFEICRSTGPGDRGGRLERHPRQVIAKLTSAEYDAQLRSAKANVQKANDALASAEAEITSRQSALEFAKSDFERGQELMKTGFITKQVFEQRKRNFDSAIAAVKNFTSQRDQALSQIANSEAEVDRIQSIIDDLTLVSPRIGRVQYQLARAGEVIAAGAPIVTILDLTDVYMTVFLPAADAGKLAVGDEARIILDPVPDYVIPAKISFVAADAQFTPKTVETTDERAKLMFRVKLKVDAQVLQQFYTRVKTGVRGMGFVRTKADLEWPTELQVKLPKPPDDKATDTGAGRRQPCAQTPTTKRPKRRRPTQNDRRAVARVKNVSHQYGATVSLADVTIDIPSRIMVGVIGPDGVGKSTLLGLIAGVKVIQGGEVVVFDKNIANKKTLREIRGRIAYMPQGLGRNLYPTLSVFENIDFFGRLFGLSATERRAKIDELLTATSLEKFEARPAGKLSGGMKQKLSLCCALINDPDLLILDEPTTGVDPLSRGQFWDLINTIRARRPQMSVIVATAYMDEAERFDWLMAMDDGKIIATGTLKELLAKTGESNLDDAFIAMMPEAKRALHKKVVVRPRVASPDETPAIEAEGLTRRFGDFVAVDHVSFRIPRGEIFGFLGSNGCGKSTTMKMLVGFLPATSGTCKLFGEPMGSNDMQARRNVGYMTQAFSLYGELTVAQNLLLHAELYHLPKEKISPRIEELLERYDLKSVVNSRPDSLPLGMKQRLQLAVAVLHEPSILILDEPTSGVDPIARDAFWRTLIDLSRDDGVTIFVTTHFMNEADRCDRISLMHAGKVLAVGAPQDLVKERGSASLEDCFVGYLAEAAGIDMSKKVEAPAAAAAEAEAGERRSASRLAGYGLMRGARRSSCCAIRSGWLSRSSVRSFSCSPSAIGISFDIENLATASFDQDDTPESRELLQGFDGSRYFSVQPPITSADEAERRLRSGNTQIVVEVPPGFGRDLLNDRTPEVDATVDGAMTFRGETAKNYVTGVVRKQGEELLRQPASRGERERLDGRRYPDPLSLQPGLSQRERDGAQHFHAAALPHSGDHVGDRGRAREGDGLDRQLPLDADHPVRVPDRQATALYRRRDDRLLRPVADRDFHLPRAAEGAVPGPSAGNDRLCHRDRGFGVLISSFTRTQVAAVFATAILSIVPAVNFSGMLAPVSSLSGGARIIGLSFPSSWYQQVSVGVFAKALGIVDLWRDIAAIALIALVFLALSLALLRKQEA